MIELRMMGGLGNQMSQVAFSYCLAVENNQKVIVDTSSYKHYKIRPCSIQKFVLNEKIYLVKKSKTWMHIKNRISQKMFHFRKYLLYKNKEMGQKRFDKYVKRGHIYSFDSVYYSISSIPENIDVYGYFLVEPYYKSHYEEICRMFELDERQSNEATKAYISQIKKENNPIAISLRLQDDYVEDKVLYVCKEEYYRKCINIINDLFDDAFFFVFADDINKAKQLKFDFYGVYVDGLNDVQSMQVMKHCKHFIISNSSFSWWGAYLCRYNNKMIFSPDRWVNTKKNCNAKYYDNMIKIEV